MRNVRFSVFLLAWSLQRALALRAGRWCFEGCETNINYVEFNDTDLAIGSHKSRACHSQLRVSSLYLCIQELCEADGREAWLNQANDSCLKLANASLPSYDDVLSKYSQDQRQRIRRLSADQAFTRPLLGEVVIPEVSFHERASSTLVGLMI